MANFGYSTRLNIIIVNRIAILVDVIAIASGIPIILLTLDHRASDAAKSCAHQRTFNRADAADHCASCGADKATERGSPDGPLGLWIVVVAVGIGGSAACYGYAGCNCRY